MPRTPRFSLDREGPQPLVEQLVRQIAQAIGAHQLHPGARMASIRGLAAELAVSTFTIAEAYDRLVAQGVLVPRRGAGFFVAGRPAADAVGPARAAGVLEVGNTWLLSEVFADTSASVKAGCGWLPPHWLDEAGVHGALRQLARETRPSFVAYGHPRGYAPLRQAVARRLEELSVVAPADGIVLTHGATQALDLVARTLLGPHDTVLVEEPGYCNLLEILVRTGAQIIGVARNAQGLDLAALETAAAAHRPRALFLNTVLQNPTGTSLSLTCAHRILQLAERYDFRVVEDDIYRDLAAPGACLLAALDGLERVIHVGSFSKTISPSTRVGYAVATPELAAALTRTKMVAGLTTSEINERLVQAILNEGRHRKHVERLTERLAQAQGRVGAQLLDCGLSLLAEPAGGMFVCASLPAAPSGAPSARDVARRAGSAGIMLAPGEFFMAHAQPCRWFRFNVAFSDDPRLFRFLDKVIASPH